MGLLVLEQPRHTLLCPPTPHCIGVHFILVARFHEGYLFYCRYVNSPRMPWIWRFCGKDAVICHQNTDVYGQIQLLEHKGQIIDLLQLLIDKTKSERGYTGTGRLITRILHTISGVYPLNNRFVNTEEWDDPGVSKFRNVKAL